MGDGRLSVAGECCRTHSGDGNDNPLSQVTVSVLSLIIEVWTDDNATVMLSLWSCLRIYSALPLITDLISVKTTTTTMLFKMNLQRQRCCVTNN